MIPVVSTAVPFTLGTILASNIPTSTAEVVTGTTTIGQSAGLSQGNTANLSTEELIK